MHLIADLICPRCDVTCWHLYERQHPARPAGHWENIVKPARPDVGEDSKHCRTCGSALSRKERVP